MKILIWILFYIGINFLLTSLYVDRMGERGIECGSEHYTIFMTLGLPLLIYALLSICFESLFKKGE